MYEQILFKYELDDAWGDTITEVDVIDMKKDNVRCLYPCVSPYVKEGEPSAKIITLDDEKLNKIKNILAGHGEIFEIKEVEFPMILDGYINEFEFSAFGRTTQIRAFNIYEFRKRKSVNAEKVIEIFDEIAEILFNEGVDKKYLALKLEG